MPLERPARLPHRPPRPRRQGSLGVIHRLPHHRLEMSRAATPAHRGPGSRGGLCPPSSSDSSFRPRTESIHWTRPSANSTFMPSPWLDRGSYASTAFAGDFSVIPLPVYTYERCPPAESFSATACIVGPSARSWFVE